MRTSLVLACAGCALAIASSVPHAGRAEREQPATGGAGARLLGRLPVGFVPNLGQWGSGARYVARIGAMTVFLEERGWTFTLVERRKGSEPAQAARGVAVRMTFAGADLPALVPEERLPGVHHYFLGNDPTRWRSDVPLYGAVRYRGMQAGVDVRAREQGGHFEYDLLLQPGADLAAVEIAVEGVEGLRIDSDGALVIETAVGPVRMPAPPSWEEGPAGEKRAVACHYALRGERRFGFAVEKRREDWALVVDPGLLWSTYLGGANGEVASAVALDSQGAVVVAGSTGSATFPTTPGAFDVTLDGLGDAFVTRLAPTGSTLVYSTFLGGGGSDSALAVAVDAQGLVTVGGETWSSAFPTTPAAFDTSFNGGEGDGFVARLSPSGANLVYSTFLGGMAGERVNDLVVDQQGAAMVTGETYSADFPTTPNAFQRASSDWTAFVTKLTPAGSGLDFSTYLGGLARDFATGLALDPVGGAIVVGFTNSADFPTTPGAFDTSFSGPSDGFVVRLAPTGTSLVFSTFLGGENGERVMAVATDAQGTITVTGNTGSFSFPTTPGAFQRNTWGNDAFVTRLSPTGATLVYSTYFGLRAADYGHSVAVDAQGAATITGSTNGSDLSTRGIPITPGAFDSTFNGFDEEAFVTRFTPTGSGLFYSTYLGGAGRVNQALAIALDGQGAATIVGHTDANDFPVTPGAFDPTPNGGFDAFVTRLDLLPRGVAAFGASSPGCTGPLAISVSSMPHVGNANFSLTCGNAPPSAAGVLAFAGARLQTPIPILGIDLWLDPSGAFATVPAFSYYNGACEVPVPIPANAGLAGARLFAQFAWRGPTAPAPCPPQGFSATNALEITIQP